MIRSISYSRYFKIPMPSATGSAATPAAITPPATAVRPVALPDWNRPNPRQTMKAAAPLYSHLS